MPPTLAQKTLDLLEDLPPYLSGDLSVQATLDPLARELQRLEDTMTRLRSKMMPQSADDEFRTLGMFETLLGLPVEQAGVSLAKRRSLVVSHLRKRRSGKSSDWVANMTEALGTPVWTWQLGPGANVITVHMSYEETSYSAGQVQALVRAITPAHVDVIVSFSEGFLIGISEIGVEAI